MDPRHGGAMADVVPGRMMAEIEGDFVGLDAVRPGAG
jgi:hypothetical protein